jgi:hypothetical protein
VLEKLDFMVRFWQLRARHEAIGLPLSSPERIELLSLIRLMASEHKLPEPGPAPRVEGGLPVQMTAPGGFLAAELRLVSAEGIVVACASTLRSGASVIVRLADAVSGVEYTLPCTVAWSVSASPCAMALRVDGAPTRMDFTVPLPGMWRSPLGLLDASAAIVE